MMQTSHVDGAESTYRAPRPKDIQAYCGCLNLRLRII